MDPTVHIYNGIPADEQGLLDGYTFSDCSLFTCVRSVPPSSDTSLAMTSISTTAHKSSPRQRTRTRFRKLPSVIQTRVLLSSFLNVVGGSHGTPSAHQRFYPFLGFYDRHDCASVENSHSIGERLFQLSSFWAYWKLTSSPSPSLS